MTVTSSSAATAAAATQLSSSQNRLANSEQTFLSLLTTQLKNQDPLSPMDSNQFTAQIVQMTGVEQQLLTNTLLKSLVSLNDSGLSNSVGMIGKTVTSEADSGKLVKGGLDFTYNMSRGAGALKLEVVDKYGATVATVLPNDLTAGDKAFHWDGKTADGTQMPDGGIYTLKITAADLDGSKIDATSQARVTGLVSGVSNVGGTTMVTIDGVQTPLSSITGVTAS
ncbi:MAG: flagellar biosynthesis protein FlgD [Caulobacteraceae bacterium]|nr:flagellar biosynthesis protein FlgD [Caulobacteraceae bacterium]